MLALQRADDRGPNTYADGGRRDGGSAGDYDEGGRRGRRRTAAPRDCAGLRLACLVRQRQAPPRRDASDHDANFDQDRFRSVVWQIRLLAALVAGVGSGRTRLAAPARPVRRGTLPARPPSTCGWAWRFRRRRCCRPAPDLAAPAPSPWPGRWRGSTSSFSRCVMTSRDLHSLRVAAALRRAYDAYGTEQPPAEHVPDPPVDRRARRPSVGDSPPGVRRGEPARPGDVPRRGSSTGCSAASSPRLWSRLLDVDRVLDERPRLRRRAGRAAARARRTCGRARPRPVGSLRCSAHSPLYDPDDGARDRRRGRLVGGPAHGDGRREPLRTRPLPLARPSSQRCRRCSTRP